MKILNLDDGSLNIDQEIVKESMKIFDKENQIVKAFTMAKDHIE